MDIRAVSKCVAHRPESETRSSAVFTFATMPHVTLCHDVGLAISQKYYVMMFQDISAVYSTVCITIFRFPNKLPEGLECYV